MFPFGHRMSEKTGSDNDSGSDDCIITGVDPPPDRRDFGTQTENTDEGEPPNQQVVHVGTQTVQTATIATQTEDEDDVEGGAPMPHNINMIIYNPMYNQNADAIE